jgi:hypothetical protein
MLWRRTRPTFVDQAGLAVFAVVVAVRAGVRITWRTSTSIGALFEADDRQEIIEGRVITTYRLVSEWPTFGPLLEQREYWHSKADGIQL